MTTNKQNNDNKQTKNNDKMKARIIKLYLLNRNCINPDSH